ncbi:MAG: DNA-formamidopyrimidine glycosylase family protein [Bacillus sp. (in: firmicutes)]
MPELPEMENYKIHLQQFILKKMITDVVVNREKSINTAASFFIDAVKGAQIISIERKAKHLLFHLNNGKIMLLHLMLGGWMFYGKEMDKPKRTIQIQLCFSDKSLYFIGLRLGYLHLLTKEEVKQELLDLGPEPLEANFTETFFLSHLLKKRGNLKLKLVDQHFLSGIGNCYSDEICYDAQILPSKKLEALTKTEQKKLYYSIQKVLLHATAIGGYMEHPFFINDKKTGSFNDFCQVYDEAGKECNRCGNTIAQTAISSKKTFYCPGCQF